MNIKFLLITFALLFSVSSAYSLSGSESEDLEILNKSANTCYYYATTISSRSINNKQTVIVSGIVAEKCGQGSHRNEITKQFRMALMNDRNLSEARDAFSTLTVGHESMREAERHRDNFITRTKRGGRETINFNFNYRRS